MTLDKLIEDIYSEQQVWDLLERLDILENGLFGKKKFSESLDDLFSEDKKKAMLYLIKEEKIEETDSQGMAKFVEKIKEEIKKISTVTLELAFEPSTTMIKKWGAEIVKEINKKIFVKIVINRQLLAGVKISFDGKFADYSIRKILNTRGNI
jgi:F0F1-type ATP synthase delta subunit